jgi:D-cysteine desulfhydrase
MAAIDYLRDCYPRLANRLPRLELASRPTPVRSVPVVYRGQALRLSIKLDNLTGRIYGGNKVRKLEYIFPKARARHCRRIATFGAAGSNHALATALYATGSGFRCTCFLSHQPKTPQVAATLNKHIENGTELVRLGGSYTARLATLRRHLWNRPVWVIPMGGSSWLGTVGFVAAGLELASQVRAGEVVRPDRLYVGSGTMGTAVGIALGLALADMETEVHAVRVSDASITNERALRRLLAKTATMMRYYDATVPRDLAERVRIVLRDEFFGAGYAITTAAADDAIRFAREALNIGLEQTYTGKALAALLHDLAQTGRQDLNALYWHTYSSVPLGVPSDRPLDAGKLPESFLRYFD